MSRGAWFAAGLTVGINLAFGIRGYVDYLDARANQYVRPAGSTTVTRIRRNPA